MVAASDPVEDRQEPSSAWAPPEVWEAVRQVAARQAWEVRDPWVADRVADLVVEAVDRWGRWVVRWEEEVDRWVQWGMGLDRADQWALPDQWEWADLWAEGAWAPVVAEGLWVLDSPWAQQGLWALVEQCQGGPWGPAEVHCVHLDPTWTCHWTVVGPREGELVFGSAGDRWFDQGGRSPCLRLGC